MPAYAGFIVLGHSTRASGLVEEFSRADIIDEINSSTADFLVASVGAYKGQLWLQRNHHKFLIPIRAYLGAAINFQAGTTARSPRVIRKLGLEWLWRIKEEPYLWRRYWNDGLVLLQLLITRVLPLAISSRWRHLRRGRDGHDLLIRQTHDNGCITLGFQGFATRQNVDKIIPIFREAIACEKQIIIDLSSTCDIDQRVLGLILMLRKKLSNNGCCPAFTGVSPALRRTFRLNGLEFQLLSDKPVV